MLKTPIAAVCAAVVALVALVLPASASSHCRTKVSGSCVDASVRANVGRVNTLYRTVYVQQVRDVVRVRHVYRDIVVHARPTPRPVVVYAAPKVPHRVMNYGEVHYGMTHPRWAPNGVTHCNCDGYRHAGYHHHPGYHHPGYSRYR
jgi:hypothetical protein